MPTAISRYQNKFTIARYQDDGGHWVAHNLSLDIVGTGKTKRDALKELEKLTVSQLNFAIHHKLVDSINHPAPERFWKMVAEKITANFVGQLISKSGSHAPKDYELKDLVRKSDIYDINTHPRFA